MNKLNKKAQLGKVISSFPVMLLIFLIIAVYLILSVFAIEIKSPSLPAITATIPGDIESIETQSILLNEITIKGEKITILDALIKFEEKEIERDDLYDELKKFVDKNNNILLLAIGENKNPGNNLGGEALQNYVIKFNEDKINSGSFSSTFANYRENGLLNQLSFNINTKDGLKKIYIESYYGRQINE